MTRKGTITIRTEGERLGMVRKGAVATSMVVRAVATSVVVRAVVGLNTQHAIVVLLPYAPLCSPSFRAPLPRYCRNNLTALGNA